MRCLSFGSNPGNGRTVVAHAVERPFPRGTRRPEAPGGEGTSRPVPRIVANRGQASSRTPDNRQGAATTGSGAFAIAYALISWKRSQRWLMSFVLGESRLVRCTPNEKGGRSPPFRSNTPVDQGSDVSELEARDFRSTSR